MMRRMVRHVMTSVSGMVQAKAENREVVSMLIVFAPFRVDGLHPGCPPSYPLQPGAPSAP